jgi:hypothetical protein
VEKHHYVSPGFTLRAKFSNFSKIFGPVFRNFNYKLQGIFLLCNVSCTRRRYLEYHIFSALYVDEKKTFSFLILIELGENKIRYEVILCIISYLGET